MRNVIEYLDGQGSHSTFAEQNTGLSVTGDRAVLEHRFQSQGIDNGKKIKASGIVEQAYYTAFSKEPLQVTRVSRGYIWTEHTDKLI